MAKTINDIHKIIEATAKDYQYAEVYSLPSWLSAIWQQIQNFLHYCILILLSLFPKTTPTGGNTTRLIVIFVLLLVSLTTLVLILYRSRIRRNASLKDGTASGAVIGVPRTAEDWRQRSHLYQKQGHWCEACRALHRCSLQMLDEAKILSFVPDRSNFEYFLSLADKPKLRTILKSFSQRVDAIYFGNRLAGEADYQFCEQSLQKIEDELHEST